MLERRSFGQMRGGEYLLKKDPKTEEVEKKN